MTQLMRFVKWFSQTRIVGFVGCLVKWHRRKQLMRALHSEYGGTRAYAMHALSNRGYSDGDYGDPRILVEIFIQSLSDPEANVREAAAHALRFSMPVAIPALIGALGDTVPAVRMEALIALGSLEAEEAIEAIAACLRDDPDEEVRSYAVVALEDIDRPSVVEHLVRALDDGSKRVRFHAAHALEYLNARARFRSACASDDEPEECHHSVVPALCKALGDEDADAREAAAKALQSVLDCSNPDWDTALEPLCAAALDPQVPVRVAAIAALGLSRDPRARLVITQALGDESEVKAQAIESLARIDPALCLEQVPVMLANPDISLQRAAVKALRWMSERPLPPEVLSYYANVDNDVCVREEISGLIALRPDPANVPVLLSALSTEENFFRHSVIKALAAMPDQRALPALIACLQHKDTLTRAEAALALAALGDEQAITPLGKLIDDEAPSVRWRAIWALSFFDFAKVQLLLVRGLKDEDAHVQSTAVTALAEVCDAPTLRAIHSSSIRLGREVRVELEEAIISLERDWGGKASGEARLVRRGTLLYE